MNMLLESIALMCLLGAVRADDPAAAQCFTTAGIVPDAIDTSPLYVLSVKYSDGSVVNCGNTLAQSTTNSQPQVTYNASATELYTILFINVDAFLNSNTCPPKTQYLLWLVINVAGNNISGSGQTVDAYTAPFIAGGKRCAFLILKQSRSIQDGVGTPIVDGLTNRNCFNTRNFISTYNITEVTAGNYFFTKAPLT